MSTKQKLSTVALVGLGAMGGAMVGPLLDAQNIVRGFDIDPAALRRLQALGGLPTKSPADAADGADVLVVMVHDAAQVDRALFGEEGAAAALPRGGVVWLASTVAPRYARSLADRLRVIGHLFIDGPVSGGVTGAASGELTVIAGGTADALAAGATVMRTCASRVFVVGMPGDGSTVKMINQLLVAAHIALTAEALAFGTLAGVDLHQLVEVVRHSAGASKMFDKRAPRMVAADHAKHSTVGTFLKDLSIALGMANDMGFDAVLTESVQRLYEAAALAGYADDSDTRLIDLYACQGRNHPPGSAHPGSS